MRGILAAMLLALALGGCAVRPPASEVASGWQPMGAWTVPVAPPRWQANGRVSLRLDDRAATASIRWHEADGQYRIELRGALGAGRLRVAGGPEGVTLTLADGEQHSADNPAELVRAVTGYELPVGFLRWWITGQPVPWLDGEVRLDRAGRAVALRQGGWQVSLGERRMAAGYALPGRVEVSRDGVQVRLAIRDWTVPP